MKLAKRLSKRKRTARVLKTQLRKYLHIFPVTNTLIAACQNAKENKKPNGKNSCSDFVGTMNSCIPTYMHTCIPEKLKIYANYGEPKVKALECDYCSVIHMYDHIMLKHVKEHLEENHRPLGVLHQDGYVKQNFAAIYRCEMCHLKFAKVNSMRDHFYDHHDESRLELPDPIPYRNLFLKNYYVCFICNGIFTSWRDLFKHRRNASHSLEDQEKLRKPVCMVCKSLPLN